MPVARILLPFLLLTTAIACEPVRAEGADRLPPAGSRTAAGSQAGVQVVDGEPGSSRLRLLFVGASLTEGWYASSWNRAYPAIVARRLGGGGRRVQLRVIAHPGATAEEVEGWNLSGPRDLVVLQIVTNDYAHRVPVAEFAAAYGEVLHRLRRASPHAELICTGTWGDPGQINGLGIPAREYDDAVRSACTAEDGRYVDLSAIYLDPADHGPAGRPTFKGPGDVFHPNDRGHAALAAAVVAADSPPVTPTPGA